MPRQTIFLSILLGLLTFELVTLVILAAFPYLPDPGVVWLNNTVYVLLQPLTTVLTLGLLYFWLARIIVIESGRRSFRFRAFARFITEPFQNRRTSIRTTSLAESARSIRLLSYPRILLAISVAISVLLAFVPYRPDLNLTGSLVGVDTPLYVSWTSQMLAQPWPQAIHYAFVGGLDGSRPLLLVLLYLASSTGISPTLIVEALPMILSPVLTLSTYIFVRYGQGSRELAGLTSLFTPISFYTTVGLWGGYYANWLALIFTFLFLTSLLQFSKSPSLRKFSLMFVLSVALFLTHPWTWLLIVTACLLFAESLRTETGRFIHLKSVIGIIVPAVALDILKSYVFATSTVAADVVTKLPGTFEWLSSFWPNLVDALLYTHGGLLGNWIILGLGALAMFALRFRNIFERLVIEWVLVASLAFLLLDGYQQARIFYDLPIPVMMSAGLLSFLPAIRIKSIRWPEIVIVLVIAACANYALQGILLI